MIRYLDDYEEQCKRCKHECSIEGMSGSIVCNGFVPMTNADRIRAMTDEQLAIMLRQTQEDVILAGGVYPDWLGLLKAEVKDEGL